MIIILFIRQYLRATVVWVLLLVDVESKIDVEFVAKNEVLFRVEVWRVDGVDELCWLVDVEPEEPKLLFDDVVTLLVEIDVAIVVVIVLIVDCSFCVDEVWEIDIVDDVGTFELVVLITVVLDAFAVVVVRIGFVCVTRISVIIAREVVVVVVVVVLAVDVVIVWLVGIVVVLLNVLLIGLVCSIVCIEVLFVKIKVVVVIGINVVVVVVMFEFKHEIKQNDPNL